MSETDPHPVRRRRRAVGPTGAPAAAPVEPWPLTAEPDDGQAHGATDDDDRLRREVPPHHGG